ncbi:MAG: hypothetical protein K2N78_10465, partial [Oscillospiraceae bacterium]|nr:hypothetical protein [Oscillospiraceae bacterium]
SKYSSDFWFEGRQNPVPLQHPPHINTGSNAILQLKRPKFLLLFPVSLSYRRGIQIGTFNQGFV